MAYSPALTVMYMYTFIVHVQCTLDRTDGKIYANVLLQWNLSKGSGDKTTVEEFKRGASYLAIPYPQLVSQGGEGRRRFGKGGEGPPSEPPKLLLQHSNSPVDKTGIKSSECEPNKWQAFPGE